MWPRETAPTIALAVSPAWRSPFQFSIPQTSDYLRRVGMRRCGRRWFGYPEAVATGCGATEQCRGVCGYAAAPMAWSGMHALPREHAGLRRDGAFPATRRCPRTAGLLEDFRRFEGRSACIAHLQAQPLRRYWRR